jgi:hypothetical protein
MFTQEDNSPGVLKNVRMIESTIVEGLRIEAAWLDFNDQNGRACQVYAERCLIDREKAPAVIHCPGGGQTVNRADLIGWAKQGFSCVSFDWQIGKFPGHDPARKSRWPEGVVSQNHYIRSGTEAVLPLAIQAAGACIDWLVDTNRVDANSIGVTGINDFFGISTLADELLNRLAVPHRRGWLPNCNHSISPGETGLGRDWGMGSTQFHTNTVTCETINAQTLRLPRDPRKADDAPSFFLNQFADPAWNTGHHQAVRIGLKTEPPECLAEVMVTLFLRGTGRTEELTTNLPLENNTLTLRPESFPGFPAPHTWKSVVRVMFQLKSRAKSFLIGPIEMI